MNWLQRLPDLVAECHERWELVGDGAFTDAFRYVELRRRRARVRDRRAAAQPVAGAARAAGSRPDHTAPDRPAGRGARPRRGSCARLGLLAGRAGGRLVRAGREGSRVQARVRRPARAAHTLTVTGTRWTALLSSRRRSRAARRAGAAGRVARADAQHVIALRRVPVEPPRRPRGRAGRVAEPRALPARAAVGADLDARDRAPARPRAAVDRTGPGARKRRARQEVRDPGRDHQRPRLDPRDRRALVVLVARASGSR